MWLLIVFITAICFMKTENFFSVDLGGPMGSGRDLVDYELGIGDSLVKVHSLVFVPYKYQDDCMY